jgi:hypothetical protein
VDLAPMHSLPLSRVRTENSFENASVVNLLSSRRSVVRRWQWYTPSGSCRGMLRCKYNLHRITIGVAQQVGMICIGMVETWHHTLALNLPSLSNDWDEGVRTVSMQVDAEQLTTVHVLLAA